MAFSEASEQAWIDKHACGVGLLDHNHQLHLSDNVTNPTRATNLSQNHPQTIDLDRAGDSLLIWAYFRGEAEPVDALQDFHAYRPLHSPVRRSRADHLIRVPDVVATYCSQLGVNAAFDITIFRIACLRQTGVG